MQPLNGYEQAKAYTETEKLPAGGYVLRIMNAEFQDNTDKGWGKRIVLSFDIAEGEYANFFRKNYASQPGEDKRWKGTYRLYIPKEDGSVKDEWTMRRFKTVMLDFEDSNAGYHWDWNEQGLVGKLVGGIFNEKEYDIDGRRGFYTNCYGFTTVEKIRTGDFKIPNPTMLKKPEEKPAFPGSLGDDFLNIPEGFESLPFN